MPGYNPWDTFDQGRQIGEGMREGAQRRRLGDAYTSGGLPAMEQEAFSQGDARTGMATRQFQNEQEAEVYNRMRRARNFIVPAIRRSLDLEPEQARQFLMQPHFMQRYGADGLGLDDATVQRGLQELTSEDPAVRRAAADRIVNEFQGLDSPEWRLATVPTEDGQGVEQRMIAADPTTGAIQRGEGSIPVPRGEIQSFGSGGLYRENPNAPNGIEIIREPRSVAGGGGGGYRPLSPEEADMYGIPNEGQGYIMGPNGRPSRIPGSGGGRYTDSASAAAGYASRMASAHNTLTGLEDTQVDPSGVWLARSGLGGEAERRMRQAQREFVNSVLRRESGAVISDDEFASAAQQYFPQPGDNAAVIEQKRAARQRALDGVINASQGAYEEWYPDAPVTLPGPAQRGSGAGAMVGAIIGQRGAAQADQRPSQIPANEWAAMTPEERSRVIQILGRQGAQ